MTMKLLLEDAVVQKGSRKSDGKTFYFVEVMQPVRQYIDPHKPQDSATLEALADSAERIPQLVLRKEAHSARFSTEDLKGL